MLIFIESIPTLLRQQVVSPDLINFLIFPISSFVGVNKKTQFIWLLIRPITMMSDRQLLQSSQALITQIAMNIFRRENQFRNNIKLSQELSVQFPSKLPFKGLLLAYVSVNCLHIFAKNFLDVENKRKWSVQFIEHL